MTGEHLPELDQECFLVAPIGASGSPERDRSDGVLEFIVAPAAQKVGLIAIRGDQIAKPGLINRQVIEHVLGAKAAVVDLTNANPNVYYEMAVRHTVRLPTVLIAQDGEKLPFDIAQMRTIFFDYTSLRSAAACRDQITEHLTQALDGEVDSPIEASASVQRLERGTDQERALAQLVDGFDDLRSQLRQMTPPPRGLPEGARRELERGLSLLERARGDSASDPILETAIRTIRDPLSYLFDSGGHPLAPRPLGLGAGDREQSALADAASEFAEITRQLRACLANGPFGQFATDWAMDHLIVGTRKRFVDIAGGTLLVRNRAPVRAFWLSLFARATRSIWTTNFGKPGENMGGVQDRNLLDAQRAALNRGTSVTRLFVYDEEIDASEIDDRRAVMRSQLDAGIDVFAIAHTVFRDRSERQKAKLRIGSDDFMIVDDGFVYLTFPHMKDEIEATLVNGAQHERTLADALAFKDVLEGSAARVTVDNLERFPDAFV